jgi:CBS domain-containing protein
MLKSVTARDYMATNLITFTPDMDVLEAVEWLLDYQISGAPVVDEQHQLIGVLSERDCLQTVLSAAYHDDLGATVGELMTAQVDTVEADTSIVELAEMFLKSNRRLYPVVEEGRLVGQISRRDVLKAFERFVNPKAK